MDDPILATMNPTLSLLRGEITPAQFANHFPTAEEVSRYPALIKPTHSVESVFEGGWVPLHRVAFCLPVWADIESWFKMWDSISVPCGACRKHWEYSKELDPPRFQSRIEFFWWSHRAHNSVSMRIGRSVWSCGRFWRRYSPNQK